MEPIYNEDLAYIQAAGFSEFARGVASEIVRLLQSATISIRKVVEVGCGAGPLTSILLNAGFAVTAIDVSAELLAIARAAAPTAGFIRASVYDLQISACEAVLAVGEPLTYHANVSADPDGLVHDFLRRAAKILPVGGILIFDVLELGEPSLAGKFWSAGEDWAVFVETSENQTSRTLIREIQTFRKVGDLYRRGRETHRVRLFDTAGLLGQLTAAGFATKTAQAYGAYALPPRRRAFFCTRVERT
jgi:SAM-dependent methyltransferase